MPDNVEPIQAELVATRDRYMRLLTDQARDERAYKAAANRAAWEAALRHYESFIIGRVRDELSRLANLVQDPDYLSDRPSLSQVRILRVQAQKIQTRVESVSGGDKQLAELSRMSAAVREVGEKLHAQHGISDGSYCSCPGCELTRSVYTVDEEGSSDA